MWPVFFSFASMAKKVLFVCLGNICRSPMAHGLLRAEIERRGLDIEVDSCGTSNFHSGEAPDSRARAKMKEKGISINDLRSRPLSIPDYREFDHILVMDTENFNNAKSLAPDAKSASKVKLFLDYTGVKGASVPDPYYGSEDGFEHVYQMLREATNGFLNSI